LSLPSILRHRVVSIPTGPPRLFRRAWIVYFAFVMLSFNPDRAAQAISPVSVYGALATAVEFQSRPGRPGYFAEVMLLLILPVIFVFQSRPGRPGYFALKVSPDTVAQWEVSIPTGPPRLFRQIRFIPSSMFFTVSIPTGPPRLFRHMRVDQVAQPAQSFNPDRAAQAISPLALICSAINVVQVSIPTGPPRLFRPSIT